MITTGIRTFLFFALTVCGVLGAPEKETRVYPREPLPDSWRLTQYVSPRTSFDTPPKLIGSSAPVYPIRQWQLGNSGEALVEFTIGEDGKARDFRIVSTSYKSFGDHAILAIKLWQWEPARKQGLPVPVRVRVPFKYRAR